MSCTMAPKIIISTYPFCSRTLIECIACILVFVVGPKINAAFGQDISAPKNIPQQKAEIEIPPPPAISLPDTGPSEPAPPLAWRQKALAMASEYPFKEKNSLLWILPLAYDQAQPLLKMSIQQVGLKLTSAYPDAGQYLISAPQLESSHAQIIIVSQPVDKSRTMFRLRIYVNEQTSSLKARKIPLVMKDLLENPGLWQ